MSRCTAGSPCADQSQGYMLKFTSSQNTGGAVVLQRSHPLGRLSSNSEALILPSSFHVNISQHLCIHQLSHSPTANFSIISPAHELKSEARIRTRLPWHGKHPRHLQYFLLKEILGLTNLLLTCPTKRGEKKEDRFEPQYKTETFF